MITFRVIPHEAIGPVRVGMTAAEVRAVMGEPSSTRKAHEKWGIQFRDKDYFVENAFQVTYALDGTAEFIEVSFHESYRVEFLGCDVHRDLAETLIKAIEKLDQPLRAHREYPCNQTFPNLGISIYREHSEKDHVDAFGVSSVGYAQR